MQIGIDSYCFHRYFGEVYPGLQADPGTRWRMEGEFLDFALKQDVGEIALEACFFDALDDGLCAEIRATLDETGVDRVLGWGHPEGLWGGDKPEELETLKRHIPQTLKLGSNRMRIVAASMNYAKSPREELIGRSSPCWSRRPRRPRPKVWCWPWRTTSTSPPTSCCGSSETVGSDYLRVNFDTGNCLRLFEDPVDAAARLAPYTVSTHTKDIATRRKGGGPSENFTWWPACPAGEGVIDMPGVVKALQAGGFDGSFSLEVDLIGEQWASLPEEEIVTRSLDYLRSLLPSGPSA